MVIKKIRPWTTKNDGFQMLNEFDFEIVQTLNEFFFNLRLSCAGRPSILGTHTQNPKQTNKMRFVDHGGNQKKRLVFAFGWRLE
jgi:hypothetical protein